MINAPNCLDPEGRSTSPLGNFESARFRGNPLMWPGAKPGNPDRLLRSNASTKVINSSNIVCGSSANTISAAQQREDRSDENSA
jgi:hypothetical protein